MPTKEELIAQYEREDKMQGENFEYLKRVVAHQIKVRNCDVEGMITPLESYITHSFYIGLIDMHQVDELLDTLKKQERVDEGTGQDRQG